MPYETLKFDGRTNLVVEYFESKKTKEKNGVNGLFTSRYRRITLFVVTKSYQIT